MTVDITDLRAKLAGGTPGPWETDIQPGHQDDVLTSWITDDGGRLVIAEHAGPDAALIAAAVNALPALLDELERLRTVTDEQVEAAAKAIYDEATALRPDAWDLEDEGERAWWRGHARAVLEAARQAGGAS